MELIMKHFGWKQVLTQFIEWWNQGRMVRQRQDYDMVCVSGSQVGTLPLLAMQWSKGPLWFKILCCTSYIKQIRCSPFEDMPDAQSSTNKVLKWSAVKSFLYWLSVAAVPSLGVWCGPSGCSPNYRDHTEASLAAIQTWLVLSIDRGKGPSQYIQHIWAKCCMLANQPERMSLFLVTSSNCTGHSSCAIAVKF